MNWAAIIWTALVVGFLIIEAVCAVHLVSIWFAAGALVALVIATLGGAPWLQTGAFAVVSLALLVSLWPFTRKFLKPKLTDTNIDSIIGSFGLVTVAIDNLQARGQVKLGAMEWSARSTSGEEIPEGTKVRVDRIEGVKVFVTPAEVPARV